MVTNKYSLMLILDITQYNKTPLHHSAWSGHSDIVQMLLFNGANIEAIDKVISIH